MFKIMFPEEGIGEETIRQFIQRWDFEEIMMIIKYYDIEEDFMCEIWNNIGPEAREKIQEEILTDMTIVRWCTLNQLKNYLTYLSSCRIDYFPEIKERENVDRIFRRYIMKNAKCDGDGEVLEREIFSYVDANGTILDQIIF